MVLEAKRLVSEVRRLSESQHFFTDVFDRSQHHASLARVAAPNFQRELAELPESHLVDGFPYLAKNSS